MPDAAAARFKLIREFALPLIVPVLVGFGSAFVTIFITSIRLEERVTRVEEQTVRHEKLIDRDFTRHTTDVDRALARHTAELESLRIKAEDRERQVVEHEARLVRLDAQAQQVKETLEELRADVKTILKAAGGK